MDDRDYIITLNKSIGCLTAKIESFCDTLTKHEIRLLELEKKQTECSMKEKCANASKETLKDELLKLLAKGLVVAVLTIGSLTGAGTIISKILPLL